MCITNAPLKAFKYKITSISLYINKFIKLFSPHIGERVKRLLELLLYTFISSYSNQLFIVVITQVGGSGMVGKGDQTLLTDIDGRTLFQMLSKLFQILRMQITFSFFCFSYR
jgi:hypothetical protein